MNKICYLVILVHISFSGKAQGEMLIDNFDYALTYYRGHSEVITKESKLPLNIQLCVISFFETCLPELSKKISFSHGQIIDLKSYLADRCNLTQSHVAIPKYDIVYKLKDPSNGIISYSLALKLDEYGQLLSINWPFTQLCRQTKLIDRNSLKSDALSIAKNKKWNVAKMKIEFRYDSGKLCWHFLFPKKSNLQNIYNFITFDWQNGQLIEEGETRKFIVR